MIQDGNLWKGLVSYTEEDVIEGRYIFSGRRDITLALLSMVKNNLLVTLYGKSGIGKTSMLQAGLFPLLRRDNYLPVLLRPAEIDYDNFDAYVIETVKDQLEKHNVTRYIAGKDGRFNQKTDKDTDDSVGNIALWFASSKFYDSDNREVFPVLVFDQFEALFIGSRDKGSEVLRGLHTMIDDSELQCPEGVVCHNEANFRIMLVVREDDLFRLEDAIDELGYRSMKDNRLRLRALTDAQAREVIEKPVDELKSKTGFSLIPDDEREEVIKRIIDISRNRSGKVDSAILSLVCSELYSLANGGTINLNTVSRIAKNPLGDFYNKAVANLKDKELGFIESLVDEQGRRRTVFRSNVNKYIKDSDALFKGQYKLLQNVPGTKPSDDNPDNQPVELVHDLLAKAAFDSKGKRKQNVRAKTARNAVAFVSMVLFFLTFWLINNHRDSIVLLNQGGYEVVGAGTFSYLNDRPDVDSIYIKMDSIAEQCKRLSFRINRCNRLKKIAFDPKLKSDDIYISITNCNSLTEILLPRELTGNIVIKIDDCLNIGPIAIGGNPDELNVRINNGPYFKSNDALRLSSEVKNYRYDQGVLWDLKRKSVQFVTHEPEFAYFPDEMANISVLKGMKNSRLESNADSCIVKDRLYSGTRIIKSVPFVVLQNDGMIDYFANPYYAEVLDLRPLDKQIDYIAERAFANSKISNVIFNDSTRYTIDKAAFINCDNLTNIYLPDSIEYISDYAFADCDNLSEVSVNANTFIRGRAFDGSPNVVLKVRDGKGGERIFKRGEYLWPWNPVLDNGYFTVKSSTDETYVEPPSDDSHNDGVYFAENEAFEIYKGLPHSIDYQNGSRPFFNSRVISSGNNFTQRLVYDKGQVCAHFLPVAKSRDHYGFIGRPIDLKEIYLPITSPYRMTSTKDKIDRRFTRTIVIDDSIKRNVTLYVPAGCTKYFVDVPEYQGFKAIKEMSNDDLVNMKINYFIDLPKFIQKDTKSIIFLVLTIVFIVAAVFVIARYPLSRDIKNSENKKLWLYLLWRGAEVLTVSFMTFFSCYLTLIIVYDLDINLSIAIGVAAMLIALIFYFYLPLPRGERMPPWLKKLLRRKGRSDNAIID